LQEKNLETKKSEEGLKKEKWKGIRGEEREELLSSEGKNWAVLRSRESLPAMPSGKVSLDTKTRYGQERRGHKKEG